MLYFGCGFCKNLDKTDRCSAFPDGIPIEIISGEIHHTLPIEGQDNDVVYDPLPEADYTLVIQNKDRFPYSTIFEPVEYEQIGFMSGGEAIIKVGYEDGDENAPLVVKALLTNKKRQEKVTLMPLYLLTTMMPEDVELIDFTRSS